MSPDAIEAAIASLRSGFYTMGTAVEQFEHEFAAWTGAKHAVMVNSGSSANLLAVEAMLRPYRGQPRWQVGDEVLVPALSWPTTVMPLVQLGLVPVFVDSDPQTLAMDLTAAERLITSKTKGLMFIHVLGLAANTDDILDRFCIYRNLTLIEDCCEAFGAHSDGLHVGRSGRVGTFSHYFSHQMTTIEGGTVITDDRDVADDLRSMRAHGWTRNRSDKAFLEAKSGLDPRFLFVTTGYNVRPMELQGVLGREQLRTAEHGLMQRDETVRHILAAVSDIPWLEVVGASALASESCTRTERRHSWMNVPIRLRPDAPMAKAGVLKTLHDHGVDTRPILAGNLLRHPVMIRLRNRRSGPCPVADRIMRDGFMIGCHPMSADALNAVCDAFQALRVAA